MAHKVLFFILFLSLNTYAQKNISLILLIIHYSEAIQPKWLGSEEEVQELLKILPSKKIIQQIITLKLMNDSFLDQNNYIQPEETDLEKSALSLIQSIDRELGNNSSLGIQKYVLYNYMALLAEVTQNQLLLMKYFQLMEAVYTLYPVGIVKE